MEGFACGSDTKCNARLSGGMTVRVKARLKGLWGTDDGNVVGLWRYRSEVSAVQVVHLARDAPGENATEEEHVRHAPTVPIAEKLHDLTVTEHDAPLA